MGTKRTNLWKNIVVQNTNWSEMWENSGKKCVRDREREWKKVSFCVCVCSEKIIYDMRHNNRECMSNNARNWAKIQCFSINIVSYSCEWMRIQLINEMLHNIQSKEHKLTHCIPKSKWTTATTTTITTTKRCQIVIFAVAIAMFQERFSVIFRCSFACEAAERTENEMNILKCVHEYMTKV